MIGGNISLQKYHYVDCVGCVKENKPLLLSVYSSDCEESEYQRVKRIALVYLVKKNNFNTVQTIFSTYSDFSWASVHKSLDNKHPVVLYMSFCTCKGQNVLMDLIH